MHVKIAICDDCETDRILLSKCVQHWAAQADHTVRLASFSGAESFLFHYADECNYDILLLDIEMGAMDGVTMAKKLRKQNDTLQIIFVTGYSDYIAEGYEVAALHYLMKPIQERKLYSVLDRAVEKIQRNERFLNLETGAGLVRFPIYQVRYALVCGNYVTIHAASAYTVKMTLSDLESQLDNRFYRAGRSCIVNLNCISRVTKAEIRLNDGTSLPLPRGAYEPLNRAIIQHT